MDRLGVGVIGVGTFGRLHARVYREHRDVELVGVADADPARCREVADSLGVKAYADLGQLLADPLIRAVSIVVPDSLHTAPAVQALRAKKHVLLEKPLATTLADARIIASCAREHGVSLMVDYMNRFSPPFAAAKQAVRSGELGRLLYINIKLNDSIYVPTRMLSWAANSSALWFLGSHIVDLVLWLVEAPVKAASCLSRSGMLESRGVHTPDFFHSVLEFADGTIARLENSWILPESGPTVFELTAEIVGSLGKIDIDTARNASLSKSTSSAYSYPDMYCFPEIEGRLAGFGCYSIDHFIRSVREAKKSPIPLDSSIEVTRVISLLEEAARSGERRLL